MTRKRIAAVLATILPLGVSACATTEMIVKKVPLPTAADRTPVGPNGIRYSLPKPFLLVEPSAAGDGSFTVETIYLPDECNTYAIDARTKRGKFNLTVAVKEGLLSKVVWSEKDAELLAESVKSGGEVLKAELERANTDKK
jgi:hypothetical protein